MSVLHKSGFLAQVIFLCDILPVVVAGTNLQALMEQAKRPGSCAEIVVVISNRPGVQGLKRASLAGIQTRVSMRDTALVLVSVD